MRNPTGDAIHRNLPAQPMSREHAMIPSAESVECANGNRNAPTAEYGFAMTLVTGRLVQRRELMRTGSVEGQNA